MKRPVAIGEILDVSLPTGNYLIEVEKAFGGNKTTKNSRPAKICS